MKTLVTIVISAMLAGCMGHSMVQGTDVNPQATKSTLSPESLNRIKPGMSKDQVTQLIGPPEPSLIMYFEARDELVWEWRICDEWKQRARFNVLFDGAKGVVRSTMNIREECGPGPCWCSK